MKLQVLFFAFLLLSVLPASAQDGMDKMWGKSDQVVSENRSLERGHLFKWGKYAMFVHWGLYSKLANVWHGKTYYGIGEWLMNKGMANADRDEYKATARIFNPTNFDAMKLARLAKDAGMKYIVITAKHHDGFAMYHSACNQFNIYDATPFHRDPIAELARACKEVGIGLGIYYSHNQDWTYPGGSGAPCVDPEGNPKSFADYFKEKCLPQVEELTRNYGNLELVWFDTPGKIEKVYAEKLASVVHENQPKALVCGRIGHDLGDYRCLGDMEVPPENVDGLWESVDVTNDGWGYSWYDVNWKSPKKILTNLLSTVARGGTYMLNVGPDGNGDIPAFVQQALESSGRWISSYPQVVYGASPSPWRHALPWGDITKHGNKLYLLVYQWPSTGFLFLPGLKSKIIKASLLKGEKRMRVEFKRQGDWTVFHMPLQQPEKYISVIELTMESEQVAVDPLQSVDPQIGIQDLSVYFAKPEGCSIYHSHWKEKFGEWKYMYCTHDLNRDGKLTWTVRIKEPGIYNISLKARGTSRVVWKIESDEGQVVQNEQGTASLFSERPMGWMKFERGGIHTITVSMPEGGAPSDLAAISMTPIFF